MKKKIVAVLAVALMFNSCLTTNAAGLKDVFDADYYAGQYPDLVAALGHDEDALYQHFLTYGVNEGRVMNPIIDVVKYRELYGDLDEAFGNNWDAYVNHFFEFGINENRDNGTDFNIQAYVQAYGDVADAFGDDYLAIARHYAEHGIHENRVEASRTVIAAREEAAAEVEAESGSTSPGESSGNVSGGDVVLNGTYTNYLDSGACMVSTYEDGVLRYQIYYNEDGRMTDEHTYDASGNLLESIFYFDNGNYSITAFAGPGRPIGSSMHKPDGTLISITEFNDSGMRVKLTSYNEDGTLNRIYEYNESGKVLKDIEYGEDNTVICVRYYVYNAAGVAEYYTSEFNNGSTGTVYLNADGRITGQIVYHLDGSYTVHHYDEETLEHTGWTVYDADGNVISENVY